MKSSMRTWQFKQMLHRMPRWSAVTSVHALH
jgi:hypothetical protein